MATITVNPATSSGGTTMDGDMANGFAATWASVRSTVQGDGVANNWTPGATFLRIRALKNGSGFYADRAGLTFDTSALSGSAVISSAILSVFGTSTNFANADSTSLEVVGFNPATKGTFIDNDWTTVGSTAFATGIAFASLNQAGYNDFTLNASGIANINKTGVSCFALITGLDLTNTSPGVTTHDNIFQCNSADTGSNPPKLVVTYTLATSVPDLRLAFI